MKYQIGAVTYNGKNPPDHCPAVVDSAGGSRCDVYGSGGPFIHLCRDCTFEESKRCPAHNFPYTSVELRRALIDFLSGTGNLPQIYKPDPKIMLQEEGIYATRLMWLGVHGNLCLALRHPQNRGESRKQMVEFVKILGRKLVDWGVLTEGQLKQIQKLEAEEGSI